MEKKSIDKKKISSGGKAADLHEHISLLSPGSSEDPICPKTVHQSCHANRKKVVRDGLCRHNSAKIEVNKSPIILSDSGGSKNKVAKTIVGRKHDREVAFIDKGNDKVGEDQSLNELIVGKEHKRRKKFVNDEKKVSSDVFKCWDFFVKNPKDITSKPSVHTNVEIIEHLNQKLSAKQLAMFKETCFGHFLDMQRLVVQNQVIHYMVLREVYQENVNEIWIVLNGDRLRFGLAEFALITGLKCKTDVRKPRNPKGKNGLSEKYFGGSSKINKKSIVQCFREQKWRSDEDAVKIAVLYFLHTFLFSLLKQKSVDKYYLDLVDTGDFNSYPWGKDIFKATVASLSDKLRGNPTMYGIGGFPLAFQVWFYECCPYVDDNIAVRDEERIPRILGWKAIEQPWSKDLSNLISSIKHDKLKLKNLSPTDLEVEKLGLHDLFENVKGKEVAHEPDLKGNDSDDDFTTPPHQTMKTIPTTNSDPPKRNLDLRVELKKLSDVQANLKKDFEILKKQHNEDFWSFKDYMIATVAELSRNIENLNKKLEEKTTPDEDVRDGSRGDSDTDGEIAGMRDNQLLLMDCDDHFQHDLDVNEGDGIGEDNKNVRSASAHDDAELADSDKEWENFPFSQISAITQKFRKDSTPVVVKRTTRPARSIVSPFVTHFDSGASASTCVEKGLPETVKSPFECKITEEVNSALLTQYKMWVDEGINPKNTKKFYFAKFNKLVPTFDFGVNRVREKSWFYALQHAEQPLSNTHIDVILYYLRKKGKFSGENEVKFTTTDFSFDGAMQCLRQKVFESNNKRSLINAKNVIAKYMLGHQMRCNTAWFGVDHVFFPILLATPKWHWIMGRLSFHERCIYVYDSMQGEGYDDEVRYVLETYSVLIPQFLRVVDFYGKRQDIDLNGDPYKGKHIDDRFEVVMSASLDMPSQHTNDCGVFVAFILELFIDCENVPDVYFDPCAHRQRIGAMLWHYGRMKQTEHVDSDSENTEITVSDGAK